MIIEYETGRIFQVNRWVVLLYTPQITNLISNIHSVDDQSMEYLWKISKSILSASQDKKSVSLIISNQIAPLLIGFRNLSTSRLSLMDCSSFFFILQCVFQFNPEDTISKKLKHTLTLICVSNLSKNRSDQENLEITLNLFHLLDHFSEQKKYLNYFEFSKIEVFVEVFNQSSKPNQQKVGVVLLYFFELNLFKTYILENINLIDISKKSNSFTYLKALEEKYPLKRVDEFSINQNLLSLWYK